MDHYRIDWYRVDDSEQGTVSVPADVLPFTVLANLATGAAYIVHITAHNIMGYGETFETDPVVVAATPAGPKIVFIQVINATTVKLNFSSIPCGNPSTDDCHGLPVEDYQVEWSEDDNFIETQQLNSELIQQYDSWKIALVPNLVTGRRVYVRVAGVNEIGRGDWSTPLIYEIPYG